MLIYSGKIYRVIINVTLHTEKEVIWHQIVEEITVEEEAEAFSLQIEHFVEVISHHFDKWSWSLPLFDWKIMALD